MNEPLTKAVVIVGVDGSINSGEALRWASRYCGLIGGELHAIIAWERGPGFGYFPEGVRGFEQEARHTLRRTIAKFLGDEAIIDIDMHVIEGSPTAVLVTESASAHLLVLGDRGYEGLAGRLLGSVAESCARRARCSVVIVKDHTAGPTS